MKISRVHLPEVMLIEPDVHKDTRGHFLEIFQQQHFNKTLGPLEWTQDNVSCSEKGTVRDFIFNGQNHKVSWSRLCLEKYSMLP